MTKPLPDSPVTTRKTDTGLIEGLRPDTDSGGSTGEPSQPGPAPLVLLHVEDNPADALLMQEYLRDLVPDIAFDTAARLSEVTIERVEAVDCALLDLSLPDASGLDALLTLRKMCEDLPIIVLTGFDELELGLTAVRCGADDYLLKNHVDAYTLERSVQYAIERRGLMLQLAESAAETIMATATSVSAWAAGSQVLRLVDERAAGGRRPAPLRTGLPVPHEAVESPGPLEAGELLTPAEAAALLYVDPKTVSRWANEHKVGSVRTTGGHRRFFKSEILAMVLRTGSDDRSGLRAADGASTSPFRGAVENARGERPARDDGQSPVDSEGTARVTEADAVARAVMVTAEALVRAAQEAAAAARAAR